MPSTVVHKLRSSKMQSNFVLWHNIRTSQLIALTRVAFFDRKGVAQALPQISSAGYDIEHFKVVGRNPTLLSALPQTVLEGRHYLWQSFPFTLTNFAHWLVQHLPKLADYTRLNEKLNGSLVFDVPCAYEVAFLASEFRQLLGIHNVRVLHEGQRYLLDELHVSSFYRPAKRIKWVPPLSLSWTIRHARAALSPLAATSCAGRHCRRLYLRREASTGRDRAATRAIENEDAMLAILKDTGFVTEEFASKTLAQRVDALRNVAIVVTQIGANVLNVLFAEPAPCACLYLKVGNAPNAQIEVVAQHFWNGNPKVLGRVIESHGLAVAPDPALRFFGRGTVDLTQLQTAVGEAARACA